MEADFQQIISAARKVRAEVPPAARVLIIMLLLKETRYFKYIHVPKLYNNWLKCSLIIKKLISDFSHYPVLHSR